MVAANHPSVSALCVHCGRRRAGCSGGRGLCRPCWEDRSVRPRYPRRRDFTTGDPGLFADNRIPPLPPAPTAELPGTPGKIAVMEARADGGFQVHHPLDAAGD